MLVHGLLQGFFCHTQKGYCPQFVQKYTDSLWIVRLLLKEKTHNPNELLVCEFLKSQLNNHIYSNEDCLMILNNQCKIIAICTLHTICEINIYVFNIINLKVLLPILNTIFDEFNVHIKYELLCKKQNDLFAKKINEVNASEEHKFYVKKSNIENAGYGLYSYQHFHLGDKLLTFKGVKYKIEDFKGSKCAIEYSMTGETYNGVQIVFDPTIDNIFNTHIAIKTDNFAPFINEPCENNISNAETVSISSIKIPLKVDVFATRHIAPHDEITMLYLRDPEKDYIPGKACPQLLDTVNNNNNKNNKVNVLRICTKTTMNIDHFQLLHWSNTMHIITEFKSEWQDNESDFNLIKLIQKYNKIYYIHVYCDSIPSNLNVLFQNKVQYIISSYYPHQDLSHIPYQVSFYENDILNNYEMKRLDSFMPFIKITNVKTKTTFLDTYNEQRIFDDLHISDEHTLQWFQKYAAKKIKIKISTHVKKPLTLQYISLKI